MNHKNTFKSTYTQTCSRRLYKTRSRFGRKDAHRNRLYLRYITQMRTTRFMKKTILLLASIIIAACAAGVEQGADIVSDKSAESATQQQDLSRLWCSFGKSVGDAEAVEPLAPEQQDKANQSYGTIETSVACGEEPASQPLQVTKCTDVDRTVDNSCQTSLIEAAPCKCLQKWWWPSRRSSRPYAPSDNRGDPLGDSGPAG